MKITLSNDEYNVLNRIASQTKMDCWFYIAVNENFSDYVKDLENNVDLTLRQGVEMLNEGIIPELLNINDDEISVYVNLLKELDIYNNPFKEETKC